MVYEHLLTLEDERRLVWRAKWTVATWIFISNRVLMMATVITYMVPLSAAVSTLAVIILCIH